MEVAGKMQVDVLHGHDLGVAAAGRAALDPEYGSQRGLAQGDHHVFADLPQAVSQPDRRGGLAFPGGGGRDGRHQDQLAVRPVRPVLQQAVIHLGLVIPVLFQILFVDPGGLCHFPDVLLLAGLRNGDVS